MSPAVVVNKKNASNQASLYRRDMNAQVAEKVNQKSVTSLDGIGLWVVMLPPIFEKTVDCKHA